MIAMMIEPTRLELHLLCATNPYARLDKRMTKIHRAVILAAAAAAAPAAPAAALLWCRIARELALTLEASSTLSWLL